MQTFIPHVDSFRHIAEELDNKRLNKQILEAWQLLLVLSKLDPTGNDRNPKGWANHPAANMWRGHELVLADYARHMHTEWIKRGYKSTMLPKIDATIDRALQLKRINDEYAYPFWMKDPFKHIKLAASHRVALLVKEIGRAHV